MDDSTAVFTRQCISSRRKKEITEDMSREYATMKYLALHTRVFIATIYAVKYDINSLVGTPYAIMDCLLNNSAVDLSLTLSTHESRIASPSYDPPKYDTAFRQSLAYVQVTYSICLHPDTHRTRLNYPPSVSRKLARLLRKRIELLI